MEHDWLELQKRVHAEFARRLDAVTDWDAPTPDEGWTVRDLVTHVVEEQQWVPYLLAGHTVAKAKKHLEPLRDDLRGWEFVCTEAELLPGEKKTVWDGDTPILVVNLDGVYYAVEDQCTHEDFELSAGEIDAEVQALDEQERDRRGHHHDPDQLRALDLRHQPRTPAPAGAPVVRTARGSGGDRTRCVGEPADRQVTPARSSCGGAQPLRSSLSASPTTSNARDWE